MAKGGGIRYVSSRKKQLFKQSRLDYLSRFPDVLGVQLSFSNPRNSEEDEASRLARRLEIGLRHSSI